MTEDPTGRLEIACEAAADGVGGSFQSAQAPDGSWVVSIELDDQAWVGNGHTKAQAMSDLLSKF